MAVLCLVRVILISNKYPKSEVMNTNEISFYSLDRYGILVVFMVFSITKSMIAKLIWSI